ncbi:MAG: class B sortase [Lachnospiraceae bacterium]|nr:class B sortase [Lachnospiraceae bacterium]
MPKRSGKTSGKKRRWLYNLLIIILAAVAVYSGYRAWSEYHIRRVAANHYEAVASQYAAETEEATDSAEGSGTEEDAESAGETLSLLNIDFDGLLAENADTVAWLYCEDTVINYPVVQTTDNEYYLHHLFSGETNSCGTLFVDAANSPDFTDDNTIIYGHYMKNGQMFRTLGEYDDQEYYEEHPTMILYTPETVYQIQIFASAILDGSDGFPLNFATQEEKQEWIDSLREVSDIHSEVEVTAEDRLVTLYTCAYTFEDARRLVFGKLVPVTDVDP